MARSWHLGNWNMWNDLLKPMAIRKKIVMKSMKYNISGNICIWYILVLVQIMPAMPEGSATEVVPLRSKSRQVRQNEAFHWMLLLSSHGSPLGVVGFGHSGLGDEPVSLLHVSRARRQLASSAFSIDWARRGGRVLKK